MLLNLWYIPPDREPKIIVQAKLPLDTNLKSYLRRSRFMGNFLGTGHLKRESHLLNVGGASCHRETPDGPNSTDNTVITSIFIALPLCFCLAFYSAPPMQCLLLYITHKVKGHLLFGVLLTE